MKFSLLRAGRMRDLRLCFLIPGLPNDSFCGQIAMFRRALDHLGGIYKRAPVIAVLGDEETQELPERWRPHFDRIITHYVPPEDLAAHGLLFIGDARWTCFPKDCDVVIFSDADTMVLRPIDDLLKQLKMAPAIAGVIAHCPFPHRPGEDPRQKWAELAQEWLGRSIPLEYTHTLTTKQDPLSQRECPFYVNYGCVIGLRKIIERIRSTYLWLRPRLEQSIEAPYFAGQIALTLAMYGHRAPCRAVDMRYNFPNDEIAEALYPESLRDLRVIHFLRTGKFDRSQIFASEEHFDRFLKLNLQGSNRIFQDHVRLLTNSRYPF